MELTDGQTPEHVPPVGDAVDVEPRPLDPPAPIRRHRLVPILAAAAAVALVAAGAAAAVRALPHSGDAASPPTAAATSTVVPSSDLGTDQVPSIAGLDAAQARALLATRGYHVQIDQRSGCVDEADQLSVTPRPGTILAPPAMITLHEVHTPAGADCARTDHPRYPVELFLAWARGVGPAPGFADRVRVQFTTATASGARTLTLRGDAVADRRSWPGLNALADVLAAPARSGTELIPVTTTSYDAVCSPTPGGTCPDMPGAQIGGAAALFTVTLELGRDHRIVAAVLTDKRAADPTDAPDVVGDSATYAAARLRAYGFDVTTRAVLGCAQPGLVTAAQVRGPHARIEISDGKAGCAA